MNPRSLSDRREWARTHLPDEHTDSVVVAMGMLELIGGRKAITRNAVVARLEAQGKLSKQRKERA